MNACLDDQYKYKSSLPGPFMYLISLTLFKFMLLGRQFPRITSDIMNQIIT